MQKTIRNLSVITLLLITFQTHSHAWPIPHSGQTKCYDNEYNNEIPCPKPGEPFYGQSGNYIINPKSFTKLDDHGNDLPDDAEDWLMVRDNVTGLIWEVKQAKDDIQDYTYSAQIKYPAFAQINYPTLKNLFLAESFPSLY